VAIVCVLDDTVAVPTPIEFPLLGIEIRLVNVDNPLFKPDATLPDAEDPMELGLIFSEIALELEG